MRELLGVMKILCILIVVMFVQLYTFFRAHRTVYLKGVNFTVCILYFSKPSFKKKTQKPYDNSTKYVLFFSILRLEETDT